MMDRLLLCLTVIMLIATPLRAERAVTVFAASSLGGVLEEIAANYPEPVVFSYGGSGAMARQVANGAPADLVVLANPAWMTWLSEQGMVTSGATINLASNQLVLIALDDVEPLADISLLPTALKGGRLAMGQRDAVPAGTYARQFLQSVGLWQTLLPQLAETDNVRAALALVARGETPFGLVYASDAVAQPSVKVVYAVPPQHHDPILYPAAALSAKGAALLDHLRTPEATVIFARHGFQRSRQ